MPTRLALHVPGLTRLHDCDGLDGCVLIKQPQGARAGSHEAREVRVVKRPERTQIADVDGFPAVLRAYLRHHEVITKTHTTTIASLVVTG